jgi:hypothetical protein|tara:strand:- start:460 stop:1071 length:612 start_codon:yes stop_codon:yes gene_type:complete
MTNKDTHKQVIFSDKKIKVYEKIIKEETAEKKRELNRSLDNKVDEVFDKKYQLFLKDIKVKKELETLKKASQDLTNFERSIENKLEALKDAVKSQAKKVQSICERQSKVNDWNESFYYSDYDYEDYNKKLSQICRDELTKQFRKSTVEGKELDAIDGKVKNLLLTLSYPNLTAKAVDLNEALKNGSSMLTIALNPNTLKRLEN